VLCIIGGSKWIRYMLMQQANEIVYYLVIGTAIDSGKAV
jgi:hypothetical protein